MIFEEDRKYGEWRKIGSFIITEGQVLSDLYSMIEHTRLLIQMEIPLRFPNESIAVDEVLSIDSISQIVGHILPNQ